MNLCKLKYEWFSPTTYTPDTGIHKYKIFGIAIVDVVLTIIAAFILSIVFKVKFIYMLVILFIIGIISHRAFCIRTPVDKWLFKTNATHK
jgi:hypothetical protein